MTIFHSFQTALVVFEASIGAEQSVFSCHGTGCGSHTLTHFLAIRGSGPLLRHIHSHEVLQNKRPIRERLLYPELGIEPLLPGVWELDSPDGVVSLASLCGSSR